MNDRGAPASDVAVLTRVTLARNFADVPFESVMSDDEAAHNIARVASAIEAASQKDAFSLARLADMTVSEQGRLADHYLISRELMKHPSRGAAFLERLEGGKGLLLFVSGWLDGVKGGCFQRLGLAFKQLGLICKKLCLLGREIVRGHGLSLCVVRLRCVLQH